MNKCIAFTNAGVVCSRRAKKENGILCGTHLNIYNDLLVRHGIEQARVVIQRDNRILELRRMEEHMRREEDDGVMNIINNVLNQRLHNINNDIRNMINEQQTRHRDIGELEKFAHDKQNVHTSVAVKQTIDILEKILKISVPTEYKWNMETCSKTPGEIVVDCGLTIQASRTMMDKYTLDNDIYEMGKGIYGRVLDCVWQYIKNSKEKDDLCKILKTELEDNVGMCEQGNLSRLANVLAGYVDGIGSQESPAEILGREFPKLWDIDDEDERIEAGKELLDTMEIKDKKMREEWIASLY